MNKLYFQLQVEIGMYLPSDESREKLNIISVEWNKMKTVANILKLYRSKAERRVVAVAVTLEVLPTASSTRFLPNWML